ncbi:MAG: ABC transporter ATP-binding protein [Pseudomonadota bacterium]
MGRLSKSVRQIRDRLKISSEIFSKVLALLRYSDRRLGIMALSVTLLEIFLTLGAFYAVKRVIDVLARTPNIEENMGRVFGLITVVLLLFVVGRILNSVAVYFRSAQGYVVSDYVNQAIQERAVAADLSFYDSALYYDSLERARQAGAQRPAIVISNALSVFRSSIMLGGIMVLFATIEWRMLPVVLIAVLLILVVQLRFTRERFQRQKELVQNERQGWYADWLMTSGTIAKEIRLWNLGPYLRDFFMKIRVQVRSDYLGIERRKAFAEVFATLVGGLLFLAAGAFILSQVRNGQAGLSDLVLIILLLQRAEMSGRDLVSSLSRLYDDQLFLSQLFSFLDLKPVISVSKGETAIPPFLENGLCLENVTFTYPGAEKPALENVSMQIKPGHFTALVGGNGSGKTTLIKLMCRLYDPQDGRITFGGIDIRELDPIAYRKELSVIFQDFIQYAYSGTANIKISDITAQDDLDRTMKAARVSGAHEVLVALPNGYDTVLSRMFDQGVELSGGQWQKIALSRAIFPNSKLVILDEPTSAIDPNAEAELFENFREKMDGRATLVISHRLSTIRQADYTYVLEGGRIAEEGSPDSLIAGQGLYAEMFARQGRGYRASKA